MPRVSPILRLLKPSRCSVIICLMSIKSSVLAISHCLKLKCDKIIFLPDLLKWHKTNRVIKGPPADFKLAQFDRNHWHNKTEMGGTIRTVLSIYRLMVLEVSKN